MEKEKVVALAKNVNKLLGHHEAMHKNIAKLFGICLEFLDESKWPRVEYGGGLSAAKAVAIKRKERKQQLITAIKKYIETIESHGVKDKEL